MAVIGFGGEKGAGKNTAARLFVEKHGFTELSFAKPLKEMVSQAFEIPYRMLDDTDEKDRNFYGGPFCVQLHQINDLLKLIAQHKSLTRQQVEDVFLRAHGKAFATPRKLLQFVGTDLVRELIDDNFWCDLLKTEASKHENVVVPDARFPNERDTIKSMSGLLALIRRENAGADTHASETSLGTASDYDVVINNNSDIAKLHSDIDTWYSSNRYI